MEFHSDYQNKEIETKLVVNGLRKYVDMSFDSIIVLSHPEYYPRFRFIQASQWNLYSDFEALDEAFIALELKENSITCKSSKVVYPKEYLEV